MADYRISLGVTVDTSSIQSQINGAKSNIKPIKINIDLNHTQSQINKIKNQIRQLNNIKINLGTIGRNNVVKVNASQATSELKKIQALARNIGKLDFKIGTLDTKANVNQIKELERQLALLKTQYSEAANVLNSKGITGISSVTSREFVNARNKLAEFEAKIADTKAKLAKGINIKLDNGGFSNEMSNIASKFDKIINKSQELQIAMNNLSSAYGKVQTVSKGGTVNELIKANDEYLRALRAVENQLGINARAERDAAAQQKLANERLVFQSKIDAWLTKNSAATGKFGAAMLNLKAQAQSCDGVTLNNLKSQFAMLDAQAEKAGLKMMSFGDRLKTQFSRYSSYFSVYTVIMYSVRALRSMFNQVVAIDKAMTELKKVTNESDASYDNFLRNVSSRAKEIGTTIDGLVSSTADFARLGYSFKESQGLAEVANIYAVVGDEVDGVEGATQSLISTMAAFKKEINGMTDSEFAMSIADKMNEVGNNYAISSGGIGEALKRSASSMAAANNTLDETIALITAANEVAQNPEKVGKWLCRLKKWLYRLNS